MAILTEREVRGVAQAYRAKTTKSTASVLRESRQTTRTSFDVFLSHSKLDEELVLGLKLVIEEAGKTVYVDWVDDPQLDRSAVTPATADALRNRMRQCNSLFYAHSPNATKSRWMPWELGYFDAFNGNVAILPLSGSSNASHKGEEFVGIYPHVEISARIESNSNRRHIFVYRSVKDYTLFESWKTGTDKKRPTS